MSRDTPRKQTLQQRLRFRGKLNKIAEKKELGRRQFEYGREIAEEVMQRRRTKFAALRAAGAELPPFPRARRGGLDLMTSRVFRAEGAQAMQEADAAIKKRTSGSARFPHRFSATCLCGIAREQTVEGLSNA